MVVALWFLWVAGAVGVETAGIHYRRLQGSQCEALVSNDVGGKRSTASGNGGTCKLVGCEGNLAVAVRVVRISDGVSVEVKGAWPSIDDSIRLLRATGNASNGSSHGHKGSVMRVVGAAPHVTVDTFNQASTIFLVSTGQGSWSAQYWCVDPSTLGCTHDTAENFHASAEVDDGTCIWASDRAALLAFVADSRPGPCLTGWTSVASLDAVAPKFSPRPCEWTGVSCWGGRVTGLSITIDDWNCYESQKDADKDAIEWALAAKLDPLGGLLDVEEISTSRVATESPQDSDSKKKNVPFSVRGSVESLVSLPHLRLLKLRGMQGVSGLVRSLASMANLHEIDLVGTSVQFGRWVGDVGCQQGTDLPSANAAWKAAKRSAVNESIDQSWCSACPHYLRCPDTGTCSEATTGDFCDACVPNHFSIGSFCVRCADSKWIAALAIGAFAAFVWSLVWRMTALPDAFSIYAVLSFGSRDGGFEAAQRMKAALANERFGWSPDTIYIDRDALPDKPGTRDVPVCDSLDCPHRHYCGDESCAGECGVTHDGEACSGACRGNVQYTKFLNPDWHKYYRGAMAEAPAMVFLLTEPWCNSPNCAQEMIWYLVLKTGGIEALMAMDSDETHREVVDHPVVATVRSMEESQRAALWSGSFFLVCDEFSRNSDVRKLLRELGCPIDNIFGCTHGVSASIGFAYKSHHWIVTGYPCLDPMPGPLSRTEFDWIQGDCIGCLADPNQQKASFWRNGNLIRECDFPACQYEPYISGMVVPVPSESQVVPALDISVNLGADLRFPPSECISKQDDVSQMPPSEVVKFGERRRIKLFKQPVASTRSTTYYEVTVKRVAKAATAPQQLLDKMHDFVDRRYEEEAERTSQRALFAQGYSAAAQRFGYSVNGRPIWSAATNVYAMVSSVVLPHFAFTLLPFLMPSIPWPEPLVRLASWMRALVFLDMGIVVQADCFAETDLSPGEMKLLRVLSAHVAFWILVAGFTMVGRGLTRMGVAVHVILICIASVSVLASLWFSTFGMNFWLLLLLVGVPVAYELHELDLEGEEGEINAKHVAVICAIIVAVSSWVIALSFASKGFTALFFLGAFLFLPLGFTMLSLCCQGLLDDSDANIYETKGFVAFVVAEVLLWAMALLFNLPWWVLAINTGVGALAAISMSTYSWLDTDASSINAAREGAQTVANHGINAALLLFLVSHAMILRSSAELVHCVGFATDDDFVGHLASDTNVRCSGATTWVLFVYAIGAVAVAFVGHVCHIFEDMMNHDNQGGTPEEVLDTWSFRLIVQPLLGIPLFGIYGSIEGSSLEVIYGYYVGIKVVCLAIPAFLLLIVLFVNIIWYPFTKEPFFDQVWSETFWENFDGMGRPPVTSYAEALALPLLGAYGIYLYGVAVPCKLFETLQAAHTADRQMGAACRHRYGFLYLRFEPGHWHAEFVLLARRSALLLISVFLGGSSRVAIGCQLVVLAPALCYQCHYKPFTEIGSARAAYLVRGRGWSRGDVLEALSICSQVGNLLVALFCVVTGRGRGNHLDSLIIAATLVFMLIPALYGLRMIWTEMASNSSRWRLCARSLCCCCIATSVCISQALAIGSRVCSSLLQCSCCGLCRRFRFTGNQEGAYHLDSVASSQHGSESSGLSTSLLSRTYSPVSPFHEHTWHSDVQWPGQAQEPHGLEPEPESAALCVCTSARPLPLFSPAAAPHPTAEPVGTCYPEVDDSEPPDTYGMVGDVYKVVSPDGVLVRRTHAMRCNMAHPTENLLQHGLVRVACALCT
eukprot:COSAG01_NODE_973_length_12368_cov_12.435732_2_plen_1763_part_00